MLTTIAFSITQLYPIFLGALWSRFSPVVWLQETGNRDMKGSRNENREGRALPRIWFLSSKEEISVEKRFAKRSRKEEVKTGRAETDSSIFPTLLSSRKDRDRDRFLVAFDVHFSNDRVSFRLYMDFLNRGNWIILFFFIAFHPPCWLEFDRISFYQCLRDTRGTFCERFVIDKWNIFQKFQIQIFLNVYLEISKIEFVLFDLVCEKVIRYGIEKNM